MTAGGSVGTKTFSLASHLCQCHSVDDIMWTYGIIVVHLKEVMVEGLVCVSHDPGGAMSCSGGRLAGCHCLDVEGQ